MGSTTAAGWYPDPGGRHHLRYWDGAGWSEWVSTSGATGVEPLGLVPSSPSGGGTLSTEPVVVVALDQGGARFCTPAGTRLGTADVEAPGGSTVVRDASGAVFATLRRIAGRVVVAAEPGGSEVGRYESARSGELRILHRGAVVATLATLADGSTAVITPDGIPAARLTIIGSTATVELRPALQGVLTGLAPLVPVALSLAHADRPGEPTWDRA